MNIAEEKSVDIKDREALKVWAGHFLKQYPTPLLVLLEGPVGVGKTQFVQFVVEHLEGAAEVCSPSFTVHNLYDCNSGVRVNHLDLYRMTSESDLESTGFWDVLSGTQEDYTFIEWPKFLKFSEIPLHWKVVRIHLDHPAETIDDSEARVLKCESVGMN